MSSNRNCLGSYSDESKGSYAPSYIIIIIKLSNTLLEIKLDFVAQLFGLNLNDNWIKYGEGYTLS